jgi:ABC-type uncharacterized transport system YnjBCD permease subunit
MDRRSLAAPIAVGVAGVTILATGYGPPCPLHSTTGWWCPLCGGSRATRALLRGHFLTSAHDNVLAVPILLAIVWAFAAWVSPRWRVRVPGGVLWAGVAVLTLFAVARNLPSFSGLAPRA